MTTSPRGTSDPNAPAHLAVRAEVLAATFRREPRDRLDVLAEICAGLRVLDVGCVAHDPARRSDPRWLHRVLADAADECVGIDVDEEGVAELSMAGLDVVAGDIARAREALGVRPPFDVVVAGEVIEHMGCVDGLFEGAAEVLRPGGRLVITTPNPYAPWRVRSGQRGVIWENLDHVAYLFPSGMVELAARHGYTLETWCTVGLPFTRTMGRSMKVIAAAALARVTGDRPAPGSGLRLPLRIQHLSPVDLLLGWWRRSDGRTGETAIYVLRVGAHRQTTLNLTHPTA